MNAFSRRFCGYRPMLEILETRLTPSCTVTTTDLDANGTTDLQIVGDAKSQTLLIVEDQAAGTTTVSLDCNGNGKFTDHGDLNGEVFNTLFETFDLRLGKGDDTVDFRLGSDLTGAVHSLQVDLGSGQNTFIFSANGHAIGGNTQLSVDVLGGNKSDQVTFDLNAVADSSLDFRTDLRGGADNVTVNLGGAITDTAMVVFDLALGSGDDTLGASISGALDTNADLQMNVQAGSGDDQVAVTLGSTVDATASLDISLGNGKDVFTGTLDLSSFGVTDNGVLDLKVDGDNGKDNISVDASNAGTVPLTGKLNLDLTGGNGKDVIAVNLGSSGSDTFDIGAAGTLQVRVAGGNGADTLTVNLANTAGSTGTLDVDVQGNNGPDVVTVGIFDASFNAGTNTSGLNFGARGFVLLEGGLGPDQSTVAGPLAGTSFLREIGFEL